MATVEMMKSAFEGRMQSHVESLRGKSIFAVVAALEKEVVSYIHSLDPSLVTKEMVLKAVGDFYDHFIGTYDIPGNWDTYIHATLKSALLQAASLAYDALTKTSA